MKIKMPDGREVEAIQMNFESISEGWNEYKLEDGTIIKAKLVVTEIYRLEDKDPVTGKYNYVVKSNTVLAVYTPEGE